MVQIVTLNDLWFSVIKAWLPFSLNRPQGQFSLVVVMYVCPIAHNRWLRPKGVSLRLLVTECIANIGIPLEIFGFWQFQWFFMFKIVWVLWSLQTSLLCIVGVLERGGSVSVAVGVSDRWQVTGDRLQVIVDRWQVTHDTWHKTPVRFCPFWYWCYYLHPSRDSLSPLCNIFSRPRRSQGLLYNHILN